MASTYKSIWYHDQHVQGPTRLCQHVQEHAVSWLAHTRLYSICLAEKQFCFQFMCTSFDTISGHFWMPHISQLWLSKHHLPQYATSTAFRTATIYTQISTDTVKLTDAAPHSAMHAKCLNCFYHVTIFLDFNSETYKGNNLKKNPKNCRSTVKSGHCDIWIS